MRIELHRKGITTVLASATLLWATGCITPQYNMPPKAKLASTPATQQTVADSTAQTLPAQTMAAQTPVTEQVSYQVPAAQPALPAHQVGQQVQPQHTQVSGIQAMPVHYAPAILDESFGQADPASCGCSTVGGCGAGNCRPGGCGGCQSGNCGECCAPQGYVMHTPQGWNAYGIDPQEFLCDGGDRSPQAMLRKDDSIRNLGLEDTVVHYTTGDRNIHFQSSNRTCIYAPRFTSVRHMTAAESGGRAVTLNAMDTPVGPVGINHELPGLVVADSTELAHAEVARRIDAMRDRNRGVPVDAVQQLEQASDVMAALAALRLYDLGELIDADLAVIKRLAQAAVPWTIDESLEVAIADLKPPTLTRDQTLEAFTIYEFPDAGRLRIIKLADRGDALPGETVTFALKIENVGDSAVTDVVVADNLTTRLEYVQGSEKVEGGNAEFTATPNEGQSLKLQWKLTDELKVGESVTIRFECKVR